MRTLLVASILFCLPAADWPQLRGPKRDGRISETNLVDRFPPKGPPVLWQRKVGEGYAAPVVADGRLIVFHRLGDQDVVECLDAASGEPRWKFQYATQYDDALGKGNGPRATPVVAGSRVFTLGAGGQLHCLELKSGKTLWARSLLDDYTTRPSFFGVGCTPLVVDSLLLVNVGGEGAGLIALDVTTGKEKWRATDDEASYSSPILAKLAGSERACFFTRNGLVVVDPATGKIHLNQRWRSRIHASVNAAMPVQLDANHVFVSSSYDTGALVVKFTATKAEVVWKNDTSLSCHFGTPVVVGDQLFGFEGRQEAGASLRCIDWKTGKVRWTEPGFGCGDLLAAGKKLFVMSEAGELVLVAATPEKYQELARARVLRSSFRSHLAFADGRLFARDGKQLVAWKVSK